MGLIIGLSGAFWAIVQAIEKLSDWKLNKEKLNQEVEELKKKANIKFYEEQQARIEFERKLLEREAWSTFNSLLKRLEANPLKLKDLKILGYDKSKSDNEQNSV